MTGFVWLDAIISNESGTLTEKHNAIKSTMYANVMSAPATINGSTITVRTNDNMFYFCFTRNNRNTVVTTADLWWSFDFNEVRPNSCTNIGNENFRIDYMEWYLWYFDYAAKFLLGIETA